MPANRLLSLPEEVPALIALIGLFIKEVMQRLVLIGLQASRDRRSATKFSVLMLHELLVCFLVR